MSVENNQTYYGRPKYQHLTTKELITILSNMGRVYRITKSKIAVYEYQNHLSAQDSLSLYYKKQYVFRFEQALNACPKEYRYYLYHSFIDPDKNHLWYLDITTKSTYYRTIRKAILFFMDAMEW